MLIGARDISCGWRVNVSYHNVLGENKSNTITLQSNADRQQNEGILPLRMTVTHTILDK